MSPQDSPVRLTDLSSTQRDQVLSAAIKAIDANQSQPRNVQVMGLVAALWAVLRGTDLNLPDALGYVDNMAKCPKHSLRLQHQIAALVYYARRHLARGR